MGSNTVHKIGAVPFAGELRGLATPLSYGFGWALIVAAGLVTMARYAYTLIRTKSTESRYFEVFGLAFLGMLIIYGLDIHYPKWNTHGALELFMVAAGTLSSLRETSRRSVGSDKMILVEPQMGMVSTTIGADHRESLASPGLEPCP
jgi:hypothetical protein